jgi:hypothetical protein
MLTNRKRNDIARLTCLVSSLSLFLTLGCGLGTSSISTAPLGGGDSAGTISGIVHGGQYPVTGATIQLYQIGTAGYTSAATPLLNKTVTTGAGGSFSITGDYTCASGTYLYITAAGGDPGIGTGTNANLAMMAALGVCDNLNGSTNVIINEVTTVAMAYALAQFAGGTTFGTTLLSQPGSATSAPADNFATKSSNIAGLGNAMATAQMIAASSLGTSPGVPQYLTPAPEWWQVNLLADILAACVNSAGVAGANTNCTKLFSNVVTTGGTAPADTIQAALAMAQNPNLSTTAIAALYGIIPASGAPFIPYPTKATYVDDMSLAVWYNPVVTPFTITSYSITSNVVTLNTTAPPAVGAYVPLTGFPTSTFLNGFVFLVTGATSSSFTVSLTHANTTGTVTESGQGATRLLFQPQGVAIDSLGNAWAANQPQNGTDPFASGVTAAPYPAFYVELSPTGSPIRAGSGTGTAAGNYQINTVSTDGGVTSTAIGGEYGLVTAPSTYGVVGFFAPAIDTNNNVWFTDRQNGRIGKIVGSGTTYSTSYTYSNGGNALDSGGNGATAVTLPSGTQPISILVDGANNVFTMAATAATAITGACASSWGTSNSGLFGIAGGNMTTLFYGGAQGTSTTEPANMVIDPNLTDTVGGTAIPGAPFIWMIDGNNNPIYQDYTASTGTSKTQGCATPLATIGNSNTTYAMPPVTTTTGTTSIPDLGNQPVAMDAVKFLSFVSDMTFDKYGNLWMTNTGAIDLNSTINAALTKATPNYGTAFTPAQAAANFSFTYIHNVAGLLDASGNPNPRTILTDGAGNMFFILNTSRYWSEVTNAGLGLSPSASSTSTNVTPVNGFAGSVCICTYPGAGPTGYGRPVFGQGLPAIDQSGNLWTTSGGTGAGGFVVIVGIAAPKVAPDSLGLKNATYGMMP